MPGSTCRVQMKIVSVITEPEVIDAILSHIRARGWTADPFEARGLPEIGSRVVGSAG